MNPYTSFWTGVRPDDGPREFHLVLLDNGRTDVLADEVGRQALRCIRCSACLNVCPVYSRIGGHAYESVYPGPIGAILTPQLHGMEDEPFAALRVESLRRLLRGLPGPIDIPARARAPARAGGGHRARLRPEKLAMRALHRAFWSRGAYERAQKAARVGSRPLASGGRDRAAAMADVGLDGDARSRRAAEGDVPGLVAPGTETRGRPRLAPSAGGSSTPVPHGSPLPARRQPRRRRRAGAHGDPQQDPGRARRRRAPSPTIPRDYRAAARGRSRADIVALFAERVSEYRATAVVADAERVGAVITERCRAHAAARMVIPSGLPEAWRPSGLELVTDEHLTPKELDSVDGAVSGCAVAIAETGTIVLDGGAAQGRRAITLVPDYHLCVVRARSDRRPRARGGRAAR